MLHVLSHPLQSAEVSLNTSNEIQNIFPIESLTLKFAANRIKIPYPLQWGAPTFDAGHAFGMMAAVLVSLIEVLLVEIQSDFKFFSNNKSEVCLDSQLEHTRLHHV